MLARQPVLVADGAMGTNLFALRLETGAAPEMWNLDHPDRVRAVHQSFVDAGSDLILTNSFGGNRYRLSLHGAQERVAELNRAAARLARDVADAAGREVLVAGSMGLCLPRPGRRLSPSRRRRSPPAAATSCGSRRSRPRRSSRPRSPARRRPACRWSRP